MNYWTPLQILVQASGELGLPAPSTVVGLTNVQQVQLLSMLNSAGNELQLYYPWEQFAKTFNLSTVADQESYAVPEDYRYFRDQTQWDANNHWPLLGPKSAQEWAWLKNSFVASLPRMRYRVQQNVVKLYPPPGESVADAIYMEYISKWWVAVAAAPATGVKDMVTLDTDVVLYDPWMMVKYVKLKFYELKGFDTKAVQAEFMRIFDSLTGKDTGAQVLSLAPTMQNPYLGPWSVPDGSWNV